MRIIITILCVLVITNTIGIIYFFSKDNKKIGYVYVEKLYDGYKGKLELEKDLKAIENKQKNILDTLRLEITDLENKLYTNDKSVINSLESKKGNYNRLVQEFSDYNTSESQKHVQSLLKQINEYVKDYGEDNSFSYIYGATGNGSLMYASEKDDLTKEILKHINEKYEGK